MDRDLDFEQLARSVEGAADGFERAKTEAETSETLIASAEYELELAKKAFADNRLEDEPRPVPIRRGLPPPSVFAAKLRKPETLEKPKWRAALGLSD
jgi:hypothetical protein